MMLFLVKNCGQLSFVLPSQLTGFTQYLLFHYSQEEVVFNFSLELPMIRGCLAQYFYPKNGRIRGCIGYDDIHV